MLDVADQITALGFQAWSPQSFVEGISSFYLVLQVAFGSMGAIALLVAAIGIANTMTMAILERRGVIHRHSFEGAPARYETADDKHHDHIIDIDTGAVIEFRSAKIEELQAKIAAELGFEVVHHRLELYCRKARPKPDEG
ncbi:MAG TPA: transcriptional repressor [Hyphomicrobiaceae bacterium]|nr:transcriptional repressor [Hyphomicrobiaceae bacterium]